MYVNVKYLNTSSSSFLPLWVKFFEFHSGMQWDPYMQREASGTRSAKRSGKLGNSQCVGYFHQILASESFSNVATKVMIVNPIAACLFVKRCMSIQMSFVLSKDEEKT